MVGIQIKHLDDKQTISHLHLRPPDSVLACLWSACGHNPSNRKPSCFHADQTFPSCSHCFPYGESDSVGSPPRPESTAKCAKTKENVDCVYGVQSIRMIGGYLWLCRRGRRI